MEYLPLIIIKVIQEKEKRRKITLIVLYGFLIGAFVTLLGGGGAGLYLGVLTSQLGMSTPMAVPTSLFVSFPALLFGFLTQAKLKNVQFKVGNRMILSAIPGIIIGTLIGKVIPTTVYDWIIGLIFIVMGLTLTYKSFSKKKSKSSNKTNTDNIGLAIALGFLAGLMAGVGGLSGGAATTAGLAIMGVSAVKSAGTSTYVLCVMALVSLIAHLFTSTVAWGSGINLMIGAIVGAIITPFVLRKLNQDKLNKVLTPLLCIIMIYFGIKTII